MGFGVAEQNGNKYICHVVGCVTTQPKTAQSERLASLQDNLLKIIKTQNPDGAVVEKLFFSKNIRTGMAVAEARGMILTTLKQANIPILELSPQQVKIGVTGYGKATKLQVQLMVQRLFALQALPTPDDAADALALAFVGLSHFH
jgi:crossover junction endodeoxyribonuclease RuvC